MPTLKDIVPADLHDRGYLKDLLDKEQNPETFGAIFKKLDNAEKLIGAKVGIPGADAKDEEWSGFLSKLRPEKADDYEIPVEKDAKPDEAFIKSLRESFLKGNINKRQAKDFLGDFLPRLKEYSAKQAETMKVAQAKADADFEALSKAAFGEDNKAVMARVKSAIAENAPAAVKPYIDKLDNNSLVILAGVIDGVMKKWIPEDKLNPKGAPASDDAPSKREEAMKLMALPEYKDEFHPKHKEVFTKVQALYAEVAAGNKK